MNQTAAKDIQSSSALAEVYWNYPFQLERGAGAFVYDSAGREYLDFYGGHCVCPLGHSPEAVVEAIAAQGRKLMFYSNWAPVALRVEAAARLLAFASSDFASVFFCNSGAEANENALKIAIKCSSRSKLVSFEGAFHGRTLLAMGATDAAGWHEIYSDWIGPHSLIAPNDEEALAEIDGDTAAVILEPIQSIGGCNAFSPQYLLSLQKRCRQVGCYLIFDEVQTGMGRTGNPFMSGSCGVCPDMMTLAKGLGGGFPMSAVLIKPEVAAKLQIGDLAATFGGHPMAMAAMMATIAEIENQDLIANVRRVEAYIRSELQLPQVKEIKGKGLLLGLVLDRKAAAIEKALYNEGIIVGHNSDPYQLHLLPPLIINQDHVCRLRDALIRVLDKAS